MDSPPSYPGSSSRTCSLPSPTYSETPSPTEYILQSPTGGSSIRSSSAQDFIYKLKNAEINLGARAWGTNTPIYGGNGLVEGRITLREDICNVSSITLKLEGRVSVTFVERGLVTGGSNTDILSSSVTLVPTPSGWTADQTFVLTFPSYAHGKQSQLPPSLTTYQPGMTCDIKYWLRVVVNRKGLRRNDSIKIPLLYLPRSFARGPSLSTSIDVPGASSSTAPADRLKIVELKPIWPKNFINSGPRSVPPAVLLSLPSVLSFGTYEAIPVSVSITSATSPAVSKLLLPNIRVRLIKRTIYWVNSGRNHSAHDFLLGNAEVRRIDELEDGSNTLVCELRALKPTLPSWKVDGIAEQRYIVSVSVKPPANAADYVPRFEQEQVIELTTDSWDSPEHEIYAIGGTPSPAMHALASPPSSSTLERTNSTLSCASSNYVGIRQRIDHHFLSNL